MDFKSRIVKELYERTTKPITDIRTVAKEPKAIKLSDIFSDFSEPVGAIIEDINTNGIKVIIDSDALAIYRSAINGSSEKQNMIRLLEGIGKDNTKGLKVDINSIREFDHEQLKELRTHCKIDRIHLNNGWDKAARLGVSPDEYFLITKKADEMINAIGLTSSMTAQEKFDKIYAYVVNNIKFDYFDYNKEQENTPKEDSKHTSEENHKHTSRDLYGFFVRRNAVCAGGTLGIINLLEMAGFECEYVQGTGKSPVGGAAYHSWIRVKIDGQWYNCDPAWDITNKKALNGEYAFKQLSDDDFGRDGMHEVDYSYNPTYIRSNDHTLRSYPERRQFERAEHSLNPTAKSSSKDIYLAKTGRDKLVETKSGFFAGAKRLGADILTLFFPHAPSKIRGLNQFIQNNASGLTDEDKKQYEKKAVQLSAEKAEKEYYKTKVKPNIEKRDKLKEALAKEDRDLTYTIPELMDPDQLEMEIEQLTAEFTSRGIAIDNVRGLNISTQEDKLRYLRGIHEIYSIDFDSYELHDICNACDRVNDLDPRNMNRVISDEEIEELKLHAEICEQMERIQTNSNNVTTEQEKYIRAMRSWGATKDTLKYLTKIADMVEADLTDRNTTTKLDYIMEILEKDQEVREQESELGIDNNGNNITRRAEIIGNARGKLSDLPVIESTLKKLDKYTGQLDKKIKKKQAKEDKEAEKTKKEAEKAKKEAQKAMEREVKQKRKEAKRNRGQNVPTQNPPPVAPDPNSPNPFVKNLQQTANQGKSQPQQTQPQTQTPPPQQQSPQR